MPKLNNARMNTLGGYKALYDIEVVDEKQKLWRGKPMVEEKMKRPGMPAPPEHVWIFFSRDYEIQTGDQKINDWDLLYHEYMIDDETLMGVSFLLVPKEKLLFGFEPESTIIARPRIH